MGELLGLSSSSSSGLDLQVLVVLDDLLTCFRLKNKRKKKFGLSSLKLVVALLWLRPPPPPHTRVRLECVQRCGGGDGDGWVLEMVGFLQASPCVCVCGSESAGCLSVQLMLSSLWLCLCFFDIVLFFSVGLQEHHQPPPTAVSTTNISTPFFFFFFCFFKRDLF